MSHVFSKINIPINQSLFTHYLPSRKLGEACLLTTPLNCGITFLIKARVSRVSDAEEIPIFPKFQKQVTLSNANIITLLTHFPHPFQTLMIILERRGRRRRGKGRRRPDILLIDPKGQMLPIIRTLHRRHQSSIIFSLNVLLGFLSVTPTIRKGMLLGPVWNCLSDFSWQIPSQGS